MGEDQVYLTQRQQRTAHRAAVERSTAAQQHSEMDLLKAELERKKKRTSELVAKAGGEKGGRRFVRRGEAARLEKEERLKNQADLIR